MALVGGGLFWLVRAVLAAIPALALALSRSRNGRRRRRWLGAGFYLVISGAVVVGDARLCHAGDDAAGDPAGPAGAFDAQSWGWRRRSCCWLRPEAITEPGFQMSFAAVAGLIAVAEWEQRRERLDAARLALSLCPRHRADQPGGKPGHLAVRDVPFRPRHPLRGAGQSAGHAGDGLCGDAGGGA